MSAPNTPSKAKKNANGSIAFPVGFRIVKRVVPSSFGSNLTTGLFCWEGKEYEADKYSQMILGEMGWDNMDNQDKERIAIYWADCLIHPINQILWTPYNTDEAGLRSQFGGIFSFKPTFSTPKAITQPNGSVVTTYWELDLQTKTVLFHRLVIDSNGAITERRSSSNNSICKSGFKLSIASVLVISLASFIVLKNRNFNFASLKSSIPLLKK